MSSPGAYTPSNGGTPSTTYSPFYSNSTMNNAKFNPTMAVIIIVLIGGCFVLGFISVFVRKCMSGSQAAGATGTGGANGTWNPKTRGLDKEAVDALPVVHCSDLAERDDRECPVCLTEFEPEDSLRLLPTCRHVFHQECIDAWFDAHSTCPLCRASLTGVVGSKNNTTSGEQGASREPAVATVTEVSDSGDSDIEILQPTPPREAINTVDSSQPAGTMAPVGATISREDSLNSARGTLSRNSQSFKRAARGVTALEKAQSLGAASQLRKPPTAPSSRKPPSTPLTTSTGIRRSSSLGTDLMALRNLLMGGDPNGVTTAAPATSSSWFTRARSMDLGRTRARTLPRTQSGDNWAAIDLESGKPEGESSTAASWSDRWSLAGLRGAMLPLSRSTSDVMSRMNNPRLPV